MHTYIHTYTHTIILTIILTIIYPYIHTSIHTYIQLMEYVAFFTGGCKLYLAGAFLFSLSSVCGVFRQHGAT